jgi:hypothetical protein
MKQDTLPRSDAAPVFLVLKAFLRLVSFETISSMPSLSSSPAVGRDFSVGELSESVGIIIEQQGVFTTGPHPYRQADEIC